MLRSNLLDWIALQNGSSCRELPKSRDAVFYYKKVLQYENNIIFEEIGNRVA